MKYLLFIIIALCIAVPEFVSAQRYLPGQHGMQVTAGTVNGLNFNAADNDFAFHAGIALSVYNRRADRCVFGAEYLEKRHPYKDTNIPQSQFTVDVTGWCTIRLRFSKEKNPPIILTNQYIYYLCAKIIT